jgi:hypothetical protein
VSDRISYRTDSSRSGDASRGKVKDLVMRAGSGFFRVLGSLNAGQRPMPDFLIIGTKRGGTTSLYYDLLKVPQIVPLFPSAKYLPKANETKGMHFFDTYYFKGLRWYRSYLPSRASRRRSEKRLGAPVIVGEASPYYLFHPLAAERAHAAAPNAKLILLLRDPVQRTYSHWKERRRGNAEELGFEEALAAESDRLAGEEAKLIANPRYYSYPHEQQSYVAQSRYAPAVKRWAALYGMENILVVPSEEYYADQPGTVARIAEFLGVDGGEVPAGERMNAAAGETLSPELQARLSAEFAEDNAELERMIGRSLPWS